MLSYVKYYDEKESYFEFGDCNGIIGGARGTIVLTGDGGATWNIISGFRYDMEEFGLADF